MDTDARPVLSPGLKEEDLDNESRKELLRRRLLEEGRSMTEKDEESERQVRGEELPEEEKG